MSKPKQKGADDARKPRVHWTPKMVSKLGTDTDKAVAEMLGIPWHSVFSRRKLEGIKPFDPFANLPIEIRNQLGKEPDQELADQIGVTEEKLGRYRRKMGIPMRKDLLNKKWTPELIGKLGKVPDVNIADMTGMTVQAVGLKRKALGIPTYRSTAAAGNWPEHLVGKLGTMPDKILAREANLSTTNISNKRIALGIAPFQGEIYQPPGMPAWDDVKGLGQPEFYRSMSAHHQTVTGKPLTHAMLSELCLWSVSRLQKWFTPGSAQQPLALPVRHHIWLAVCHGITERDPS